MKDSDIVYGIAQNNQKVLSYFYNLHVAALTRFVNRKVHDINISEELVQDTFLDFIEKIYQFKGKSTLKTYLFSIARNKMVDFIRKKKLKQVFFSSLPSFVIEKFATVFIDETLEKKELEKKIKKTFLRIPHDYRVVLRLKYIEDLSVIMIAQQMSVSFKAAESMLFRARKAFIKAYYYIA